jgi:Oxygenase domain of the 2OGFeDO superfamily
MVQDFPQPSVMFRRPAASEWLDDSSESNLITSAILAVIHPELHKAGRETLNRLRQYEEIQPQDVLRRWTSAFSGVSVIVNRLTPPHRDGYSRNQWYDLLVTLGRYEDCNLELPGLGLSLEYGPGTVVGLMGMVLEHEVTRFKGERVCYAYWMRDVVHEWASVPGNSWMYASHYQ